MHKNQLQGKCNTRYGISQRKETIYSKIYKDIPKMNNKNAATSLPIAATYFSPILEECRSLLWNK